MKQIAKLCLLMSFFLFLSSCKSRFKLIKENKKLRELNASFIKRQAIFDSLELVAHELGSTTSKIEETLQSLERENQKLKEALIDKEETLVRLRKIQVASCNAYAIYYNDITHKKYEETTKANKAREIRISCQILDNPAITTPIGDSITIFLYDPTKVLLPLSDKTGLQIRTDCSIKEEIISDGEMQFIRFYYTPPKNKPIISGVYRCEIWQNGGLKQIAILRLE